MLALDMPRLSPTTRRADGAILDPPDRAARPPGEVGAARSLIPLFAPHGRRLRRARADLRRGHAGPRRRRGGDGDPRLGARARPRPLHRARAVPAHGPGDRGHGGFLIRLGFIVVAAVVVAARRRAGPARRSPSAARSPRSSSASRPSRRSATCSPGIVLIAVRPFKVGDRVRLQAGGLAGQIEGVVASLGLLYTTFAQGDDSIMVPNNVVLSAAVVPLREPPPWTCARACAPASSRATSRRCSRTSIARRSAASRRSRSRRSTPTRSSCASRRRPLRRRRRPAAGRRGPRRGRRRDRTSDDDDRARLRQRPRRA